MAGPDVVEGSGIRLRFLRRWLPVREKFYCLRCDVYLIGDRARNIQWGYWVYPSVLEKLLDRGQPWLR